LDKPIFLLNERDRWQNTPCSNYKTSADFDSTSRRQARSQVLRCEGGQDFCFYDTFKTKFFGHNKIWGISIPECPPSVAADLLSSERMKKSGTERITLMRVQAFFKCS